MFDHEINQRLAVIEQQLRVNNFLLRKLLNMEIKMNTTLADLLTKASAIGDAALAFKTIDDGIKAHVVDLQNQLTAALVAPVADQATIDAINAKLDLANATLAGATAVVVNTPAAPVPAAS